MGSLTHRHDFPWTNGSNILEIEIISEFLIKHRHYLLPTTIVPKGQSHTYSDDTECNNNFCEQPAIFLRNNNYYSIITIIIVHYFERPPF